jgi:hypothetical protein
LLANFCITATKKINPVPHGTKDFSGKTAQSHQILGILFYFLILIFLCAIFR